MSTKTGPETDGPGDPSNKPDETVIPQRGPGRPRKPRAERRNDQMSIRVKSSTRDYVERLSYELDMPIAEIFEKAILAWKPE